MSVAADKIPDLELSDIAIIGEGRITAIFGPAGWGKSCIAAMLAEGARLRDGRPVFFYPASFAFHKGQPLRLEDLIAGSITLAGALVVIEEFQQVFSKYLASSLSHQNVTGLLEQIRKLDIDLIITSNNENMIDLEAFMPHVKLRLDVVHRYIDPRCGTNGRKFHLKDCRDSSVLLITDERRRHGRSRYHWDGKKRYYRRVRRMIQYYPLYNTFASVSAMELRSMDADAVRMAHEDSQSEMEYSAFLDMLATQFIPEFVQQGGTELVVFQFSKWLEQRNIKATPERITRGCKDIGLIPVRGSGGNRFKLPSAEDLGGWLTGIVSGA